jgi:hypothetical protein
MREKIRAASGVEGDVADFVDDDEGHAVSRAERLSPVGSATGNQGGAMNLTGPG